MVKIIPQSATRLKFANALDAAEYAARLCYRSEVPNKGREATEKFLIGLAKKQHGTPFEHGWLQLNKQDLTEQEWHGIDMLALDDHSTVQPHVMPVDQFTYDETTKTIACNMRSLINLCGIERAFQLMDKAWYAPEGIFTFEIITSRAIGNQLIRHRALSFEQAWALPEPSINQESLRWVRMDDPVVCLSDGYRRALEADRDAFHIWRVCCERSFETYKELCEKGFKKEFARTVLPLATATRIIMTAQACVWYEFLKLRLGKTAEPMMKELSADIFKQIKTELTRFSFDCKCEPFSDYGND